MTRNEKRSRGAARLGALRDANDAAALGLDAERARLLESGLAIRCPCGEHRQQNRTRTGRPNR